jgi:competence protein ComFB
MDFMERTMTLEDNYNLDNIRNHTKELVYQRVEELLTKRDDVCSCETCVLDLVAFTLNRVTPRYTTSLLGDLHPDQVLEKKIELEIELALDAGVKQLQMHPHHG